jgi:hypothetical protein
MSNKQCLKKIKFLFLLLLIVHSQGTKAQVANNSSVKAKQEAAKKFKLLSTKELQDRGRTRIDIATVLTQFTITTFGTTEDIKVKKVKCKGCSAKEKEYIKNEAIKIISSTDDFKPFDKPIRFSMPVKFEIL